jgi:hypothetical protein
MNEQNEEPETAKLLDEIRTWFEAHVVAGESQVTALILLPAAAWAGGTAGAFPTMPRALVRGPAESGKTTAMNVSVALGPNATDADGTYADLKAALAEAANTPEDSLRFFYYDEIGENYGDDGQNRGGNKTLDKLLRKGYKRNATDGRSRNGVSRKFSIFFPVIMTGRDISVPVDIRSRTIVIPVTSGDPERYFDVRESEGEAEEYSKALGVAVREHLEELKAFRARGYHPKLTQRKLEVWEPLFAVAKILGGQRWLNMCLSAFLELALASEQVALTPRQRVLRDLTEVLDKVMFLLPNGRGFAGGEALADELKHYDPERYGDLGMTQVIARSMRPVEPRQVRVGETRTRGYYVSDIRDTWEEIKPAELRDVEDPEEENAFAVVTDDDSEEEVFEVRSSHEPGREKTGNRGSRKAA